MAVEAIPYASLGPLLRRHWVSEEDEGTAALIRRTRTAWRRGYLTTGELVRVCRWKSPRSAGRVLGNNHHRIRRATAVARAARDERTRVEALIALHGISIPSASAVLTMLDPRRYGVIDIRVWQLLHAMGAVEGNAAGTKLTCDEWIRFLHVIRSLARRFDAPARTVERSLFAAHRAYQQGLLYSPSRRFRRGSQSGSPGSTA